MQFSSSRTLPRQGMRDAAVQRRGLSGRSGRPLAWRACAAKCRARAATSLRPLAQRRQLQGQHIEAEQQILAEAPSATACSRSRLLVAIRRMSTATGLRAADAVDLALLDGAQQLGLEPRLHLADLVEQQRAAVRLLEPADRGARRRR